MFLIVIPLETGILNFGKTRIPHQCMQLQNDCPVAPLEQGMENQEKYFLFGCAAIHHKKTSKAKRMTLDVSPFAASQLNNIAMRQ